MHGQELRDETQLDVSDWNLFLVHIREFTKLCTHLTENEAIRWYISWA